ncbi:hypothetical protein YN1_7400 [Nanoarchaeota archaeon]
MNFNKWYSIINNKYLFTLLTSIIASLITVFILFHRYIYYSVGDNVFPLSLSNFYNFQPFFTNINGGSIGDNIILIIYNLFYFTFLNKYGELFSFLITTFIGNTAISLLIYKNLKRANININNLIFIITILSEIFLNSGLNLYYELLLLPNTFIPIHAIFPWVIYLIDSIVLDNDKMIIKILEMILSSLLIIIFMGPVLTLVLTTYFSIGLFFILLLLTSKSKIKNKIYTLFLFILIIFILNLLSLLPVYFSSLHYFSTNVGGNYYVGALKSYIQNTYGNLLNTLSLSYYPINISHILPDYYIPASVIFTLLFVLPIIFNKDRKLPEIYYASLIIFLLLSLWLSAPYIFPEYINLYSSIPYLWSLDIPWLSFTYFLFLFATIILAVSLSTIKNRIIKTFIILIFVITLIINIYPYYTGKIIVNFSTNTYYMWNPPNYLWKISNVINNGPYKDPRILILPTSGVYVSYNYSSNNIYVGAGFWSTLLNGNVYSSYYPYNDYSLEWFTSIYPTFNFSDYVPLVNLAKILGINYIIITKNFISGYYYPSNINHEKIDNIINYLSNNNYSVMYNNSQITVYNFSSENIAVIPNYIIFVNTSDYLWTQNYPNYNSTVFYTLINALNLSFLDYSSTALVNSKYKEEILRTLDNYKIIYKSNNIEVIKIIYNTNKSLKINIINPNEIYIDIYNNNENIPILIRQNYQPSIEKYITGFTLIVPGYANESFIIFTNSSKVIIDYNNQNIFQYIYLIYFYTALIIAIILFAYKNNFLYKTIKNIYNGKNKL